MSLSDHARIELAKLLDEWAADALAARVLGDPVKEQALQRCGRDLEAWRTKHVTA